MRAMVLSRTAPAEDGPLELREVPDPAPREGELLLAVSACAVCRTDLQICEGDLAPRHLPTIPGHQIVGRVVALGPGARGFAVGQRAGAAWLASACGVCAFCRSGRENLCEKAAFTGWDKDGGYAERVAVRAGFALPLPESVPDEKIAPLLCGGIIGYRSLHRANTRPGSRLGLYGFGASASLAIQVARYWGCRVFVFSRTEKDLARARELGAEWTGGYEDLPPEPLESAVTFAPSGDVVRAALKATGRGGTVAINAIHLDRIPELAYGDLWWEKSLVSVANFTRKDATELLELAAKIPIETRAETMPLTDANAALQHHKAGLVDGAAVLTVAR